MWRDVDDRARSEVAKFGPANLRALRAIADGTIGDGWQGQRLDPATVELIASFDYDTMDPHTAAALFWYVRNDLYFRLGLHRRDDVLLVAYQDMVEDPESAARRVCAFLDLPYRPEFAAEVAAGPARDRLPIDPLVRALCDDLTARLQEAGVTTRG
jgi:sulfotransferase family protein